MNRIPFEAPNKWSENDWKCEEIKHSNLIFCLLAFLQTSVKLVDLYCLSPWCWSTPKETERIKNGPSKRGKENQERIMEIRQSKAECIHAHTVWSCGVRASPGVTSLAIHHLVPWGLTPRRESFKEEQLPSATARGMPPKKTLLPPPCAWTPRLPTLSTREWPHLLSHP